jgi:hypothetical protein
MAQKLKPVCPDCKSDSVIMTVYARWDVEKGCFEPITKPYVNNEAYCDYRCPKCGSSGPYVDWVTLEGETITQ